MTDSIELAPPAPVTRDAALETVALAAALLFEYGQTTERVVVAAERLGHALGVPVLVLPHWGELTVEIDRTPFAEAIPAMPLGVDMGKVLAVVTVVDRICDGTLPREAARAALAAAGRQPSASTLRFALFAALGAASLCVIFGALDAASLLLIAASSGIGALVRRGLGKLGGNPFIQPLCASAIAGAVAVMASRWQLSEALSLVAFCSPMSPPAQTAWRERFAGECARRLCEQSID